MIDDHSSLKRKSKAITLPQVEQYSLKQLLRQRKINFESMLTLPVLLQEGQIRSRKDTIAIFRRRKLDPMRNQKSKIASLNPGKIHMNEFWSEKYQEIILKDSSIAQQLNNYSSLIKDNIQGYLDKCDAEQQKDYDAMQLHSYKMKSSDNTEGDDYGSMIDLTSCNRDDLINNYYRNSMKNSQNLPNTVSKQLSVNTMQSGYAQVSDQVQLLIQSCDKAQNRKIINIKHPWKKPDDKYQ